MEPIKQLSQVSTYKPRTGLMLTLYDLFRGGASRGEAESCFNGIGKTTEHFREVYGQLKRKLLGGVLFYSFNDYSKYIQLEFKALNDFTIAIKLIRTENKLVAIPESEKVFEKLVYLGLTEFALAIAIELEHHYAVVEANKKKYDKYKEWVRQLRFAYFKEIEIIQFYNEVAYCITRQKELPNVPEELKTIAGQEQIKSYRFNLFYYSTANLWHRVHSDHVKIIYTCKQALAFFTNYENPLPYTTTWNFQRQMIPIHIAMGENSLAEVMASKCLKVARKGSFNWHISLIYKALVGFHSNKPKIAFQAWKTAHSVPMKFKQTPVIKQRWLLIQSYLELYAKLGRLHMPQSFRLYKFLNSVPTLNADKGKNNVAVIVCHLLHLWIDHKKEAFGDKAKQLRAYTNRHLNRSDYDRPRWFLLMLEKFYDANFHPVRYQPRIKYLWKKINNSKSYVTAQVFETEVIPFELAWQFLTEKH
ncbi:MAG: hypothetical protein AAFZ15_32435 [Bacteroidota bacterium]